MTDLDEHDAPVTVALPEAGTGLRAKNRAERRHRRRVQQAWFMAAVAVLAVAIPVLAYIGFRAVYNTTQGRKVDAQNDPTKPNFEANVVPTPVLLLAQAPLPPDRHRPVEQRTACRAARFARRLDAGIELLEDARHRRNEVP